MNGSRLIVAVMLVGGAACVNVGDEDPQLEVPEPVDSQSSEIVATPLVDEPDDVITNTPWETLGVGVSHKALAGGSNALLVYGGYTAADAWVQRWANALVREKGGSLGIGHLYAIRGPNQAGYANREIQNSRLAAHLGSGIATAASSLYVVAHSSGTYVADELFGMLKNGAGGAPAETLGKVHLFNLDGGGVASASRLSEMARAYFVYAYDGDIRRSSHNASSMKSLGAQYASLGGAVEIDARGSGCSRTSSGGLWCLHDTLINTRPFNPDMYDLKNDYTDFTGGRRVVTTYLDAP